ncbi:hypothetical protein U9M48_013796 [Paspalum notatum var. saurae]|uniref:Uncharacterized protein n=1 Tax=Paspalum notatum var. saurae TaxID=547442 RepID=A0AAQ3T069_PASNO
MKLLLCAFKQLSGLKINFHKSIPMHFRRLSNLDWKGVEERFEKRLSSWKGVLKKLDYFRLRFFWRSDDQKRKYRLAKWSILCQLKDQGGLGIQDLDVKNTALLSKWLFKLLTSDGTWQEILRNKYLNAKPLSWVLWKKGDSHFWASLMKVKDDFLRFGTFTEMGHKFDKWLGNTTLRRQYPCLYNIARHKQTTVAEVFSTSPLNLSWRRTSSETI